MARIDGKLLRELTAELRRVGGIERTPEQVSSYVFANAKRPNTFVRDVLKDADALRQLVKLMRLRELDDAPPLSELE